MEKIIKVNNLEQKENKENSKSSRSSIIKKGNVIIFDFSGKSEDGKRVLLLSVIDKKSGKKIRFNGGDDKLFLGVFSDKNDAKLFAFQIIIFLEKLLGVKMSFSIKKETIIAIISLKKTIK